MRKGIRGIFGFLVVMTMFTSGAQAQGVDGIDGIIDGVDGIDGVVDTGGNVGTTETGNPQSEEVDAAALVMRGLTARQQAGALQRRFGPGMRGLDLPGAPGGLERARAYPAAGEGYAAQGWTVWSDDSYSRVRDRRVASNSRGDSLSFTFGVDRMLSEALTLGASVNYLRSDVNTYYNAGDKRTRAYAVSLYLNYQLAEWLSLEAQGGYVRQRQRLRRNALGGAFWGSRSSNGSMITASLNAARWHDNVLLSARAGVIATRDRWRQFTEYGPAGINAVVAAQTDALVQGVVEGGIAFWLDPIMPFASITYTHDLSRKGPDATGDRDDFTLTGGLSWHPAGELEGFSLEISASYVAGRSERDSFMAGLGVKWSW